MWACLCDWALTDVIKTILILYLSVESVLGWNLAVMKLSLNAAVEGPTTVCPLE